MANEQFASGTQGQEVTGKIGAPSKYFAPAGVSSSIFGAAGKQVRTNYELYKLDNKKSKGEISDKEYITELQRLQGRYATGTGLRQAVTEKVVTGAQTIADTYQQERQIQQQKMQDEAATRWNVALDSFALGQITAEEFAAEKNYYMSAMTTVAKVPTMQDLVQKITGGKFWDQYKSGKMRTIKREKQIKEMYNQIWGQDIEKKRLKQLSSSEMSLETIKQLMESNKLKKKE